MKIKRFTVGSLDTNCYAVFDDAKNDCVIIDPGFPDEDLLDFAGDNKDKIRAILLTHKHYDHILGLKAVKDIAPVDAYIHEEDFAEMSDCRTNCYYDTEKKEYDFSGFKADKTVSDGDILCFGELSFRVLHTPGHSKGSVCYLCGDSLFTGDTLFHGSIGNPFYLGGSMRDMKNSLKKLCSVERDYCIFPGHGEDSTLVEEKINNPHLRRIK